MAFLYVIPALVIASGYHSDVTSESPFVLRETTGPGLTLHCQLPAAASAPSEISSGDLRLLSDKSGRLSVQLTAHSPGELPLAQWRLSLQETHLGAETTVCLLSSGDSPPAHQWCAQGTGVFDSTGFRAEFDQRRRSERTLSTFRLEFRCWSDCDKPETDEPSTLYLSGHHHAFLRDCTHFSLSGVLVLCGSRSFLELQGRRPLRLSLGDRLLRVCVEEECAQLAVSADNCEATYTSVSYDGRLRLCAAESCSTADTALGAVEEVTTHLTAAEGLQLTCTAPRYLQTTHTAAFSYQRSITLGTSHYYTFDNTHVGTQTLAFEVVLYAYPGYIYFDLFSSTYFVSPNLSNSFTPTSSPIVSRGGITGLYTVRVYSTSYSLTYELRVRIVCTSTTGACYCAGGSYPNSSTASCAACPAASTPCQNYAASNCLPVSTTSSYVAGSFYCSTCIGRMYDQSTGKCQCYMTCRTCQGLLATDCLTCMPNATLDGTAPTTCTCTPQYYASSSQGCAPCYSECKTCSSGGSSSCTSCYSNASLTAPAPSSCVCNVGYGYYPESCQACDPACATCDGTTCTCNEIYQGWSANCQICHDSCLTCVWSGTFYCKVCKYANNRPYSGYYDSCQCASGYYPNPDYKNCVACDSTCYNCNGIAANACTGCKSGASLTSGSPSACTCRSDYFPNPTPANCSPCATMCKTCSGSSTLCGSCWANAAVNASSACVCGSGYFPSSTAANCVTCSPLCKDCTGSASTECTTCWGNAQLQSASPSSCKCATGAFPNPNVAACALCHTSCLSCQTTASSMCTGCKANAQLLSGSPSACVCLSTAVGLPDASNCVVCDLTCLTCSGAFVSDCTQCKANAQLAGASPNSCVCTSGYFPNLTVASCSACSPTCKECSGASTSSCSQCYTNAQLLGLAPAACQCISHYFGAANSCAVCDPTCLECSASTPSSCTSCNANGQLTSATPSACECSQGFFPNPTPADCQPCSPLCFACAQSTDADCTSCHPSAQLVTPPTSKCECEPGFTTNPDVAHCVACDSSCLLCANISDSDCTACKANASLPVSASVGACTCDTGFFPDPTPAICTPCDVSCLNCSGKSSSACTSCKPLATLDSSTCRCDPRTFPNPTAGNCTPCDVTCKECVGATASQCVECWDFAALDGPAPAACFCEGATFPSPDSSKCKMCSETCLTCQGTKISACLSCKLNAQLKSSAPSECECKPGFVPSPDASQCLPCSPVCAKCASASECALCKPHAELREGSCTCAEAFYGDPDASNCKACSEGCVTCISTGCSKCGSALFLIEGGCVRQCPQGYTAGVGVCELADLTPPNPSLSVTSDNALSVFFDKAMNCTVLASEISVQAQTKSGDIVDLSWQEPTFQSPQTLLVKLEFQSDYLEPDCIAELSFLSAEKVVDEYGVAIGTSTLSATLMPFGTSPSNTTGVLLQTSAAAQAAAASKGGVSAGAAASLLNGNPACLISLVNQLQLITYLSMTKLPLPADFASALAALNIGQMLPNPLPDMILTKRSEQSQTPPQHVKDYGISTLLFLTNSLTFVGTSILVLSSFVPFYFLSKVKIKFVADYFRAKLPSLRWNTPIQLWATSYLDIGVFSLLQLFNAERSVENWFVGLSLVLAGLFATAFVLTPICVTVFLVRNFNLISSRSDPDFCTRWGILFLPFKANSAFASVAFYSIFAARRLVLAVTLVAVADYITVLALVNTSFSLFVQPTQTLLFTLAIRPYAERIDQMESVLIESSTFIVYCVASAFLLNLSASFRDALNQVGMWTVRVAIFGNVFMSMIRSAYTVFGLVKAYENRINEVKARYVVKKVEEITQPNWLVMDDSPGV